MFVMKKHRVLLIWLYIVVVLILALFVVWPLLKQHAQVMNYELLNYSKASDLASDEMSQVLPVRRARPVTVAVAEHSMRTNRTVTSGVGNFAPPVEPAKNTATSRTVSRDQMIQAVKNRRFRLMDSLSRFGDELDFDYNTCPPDSVLRDSAKRDRPPLHNDCPHVFIIGVRKGGTSSLIHYLTKHQNFSSVYMGTHYAGETAYFYTGYERNVTWQSYTSLFAKDKMTGDSSVDNFVNCLAPERIYESCGKVKVILLLRDPVKRFQSHYRFSVLHKNEDYFTRSITSVLDSHTMALLDALEKRSVMTLQTSLQQLAESACLFKPAKNMVYEGLYLLHLHRWLCNFPAENMLILSTEEFAKSPGKIVEQVMDFIGLSHFNDSKLKSVVSKQYNTNPVKQSENEYRLLTSSQKQRLGELYHNYNTELFNLLLWTRQDLPWD